MVRHMAIEFPEDKIAWNLIDQYMFGSEMLVAPILEPGKVVGSVYLRKVVGFITGLKRSM